MIPEWFAHIFPMNSEITPVNMRTIRGVALPPIFCRWGFFLLRPTLDDSFRSGPTRPSPEEYDGSLAAEKRRFILWGLKEGWSAARIGRALKVNEAAVTRFRRGYWEDPERLLKLGLFQMVDRAKDQEFKCLVCEEKVESKSKTKRRILSRFLEESAVEDAMQGR